MADIKPGSAIPPHLRAYWSNGGEGGAKIRWNSPEGGDFERCVRLIGEAVAEHGQTMPPAELKGMCNELHQLNAGGPPGHGTNEHAKR